MAKTAKKSNDIYSSLRILRTESKDDLNKLFDDISRDIQPADSIEKLWVGDIVSLTWDIMRYRRIKTGLLANSSKIVVEFLFDSLLPQNADGRWASEGLKFDWSGLDSEAKRRAEAFLLDAGIDEVAIEARAYKAAADALDQVGRMENAAQAARDKALRSIAKYRKSFAAKLQRSTDRVLAADEVPSIANEAED
jgi:hypothetical protein